jgi:hypothetical protein
MSEWSYYDKDSIIRDAKSAKQDSAEALREIKALKEQFALYTRQQKQVMEQQEAILKALVNLGAAVGGMHAEMYPQVEDTKKPSLKDPAKSKP